MSKKQVDVTAQLRSELDSLSTVSAKIRYLDSVGTARADIARILDKRYQHVKNVLDKEYTSEVPQPTKAVEIDFTDFEQVL